MLLPDCSLEEGHHVIQSLLSVTPHGQTASAGLTGWTADDSADTLTARADTALYAAKAGGRNQAALA